MTVCSGHSLAGRQRAEHLHHYWSLLPLFIPLSGGASNKARRAGGQHDQQNWSCQNRAAQQSCHKVEHNSRTVTSAMEQAGQSRRGDREKGERESSAVFPGCGAAADTRQRPGLASHRYPAQSPHSAAASNKSQHWLQKHVVQHGQVLLKCQHMRTGIDRLDIIQPD